jgi:hypothetical protein
MAKIETELRAPLLTWHDDWLLAARMAHVKLVLRALKKSNILNVVSADEDRLTALKHHFGTAKYISRMSNRNSIAA